jgi:hypothetical protein
MKPPPHLRHGEMKARIKAGGGPSNTKIARGWLWEAHNLFSEPIKKSKTKTYLSYHR